MCPCPPLQITNSELNIRNYEIFDGWEQLLWHNGKASSFRCRRHKRHEFDPWSERSPGVGNGNPLQYSYLENSTDRGAWWATIHGMTKSQTRLGTVLKRDSENTCKPTLLEKQIPSKSSSLQFCQNLWQPLKAPPCFTFNCLSMVLPIQEMLCIWWINVRRMFLYHGWG